MAIDTFLKNRKKNSNLNISFNIEDTNLKFWNMIVQSIVDQKLKKKIKNYKDGGRDVISKNRTKNLVSRKSQQPVGVGN